MNRSATVCVGARVEILSCLKQPSSPPPFRVKMLERVTDTGCYQAGVMADVIQREQARLREDCFSERR